MSDRIKQEAIRTEFGQRVSVARDSLASEDVVKAVEYLKRSAEILHPLPASQESLKYVGSCAVHIYQSPMLGQVIFVSQTPLGGASEPLAAKATEALRSDIQVAYGRKRRIQRSGL